MNVVLLSGGLDSATVAAIAKADGFAVYALSIDYGQRHRFELQSASRVAAASGVVEHRTVRIDLGSFGGSALTADIEVPHGRSDEDMAGGVPITYVPARNTVMLSLALTGLSLGLAVVLFVVVDRGAIVRGSGRAARAAQRTAGRVPARAA